MKNRVVAFLLALVMVLSLVPVAALSASADELAAYTGTTFTDPYGEDITATVTDGDTGSYTAAYGDITWYDKFEDGYAWALRAGKLIIGGNGAVEEDSYPWTRFADEITEIVIFPNTVTSIGKDAFKGLNKVEKIYIGEGVKTLGDGALACGADGVLVSAPATLTSVGAKVLDGCENVKVVLNGATVADVMSVVNEDNAVLAAATFVENTVKSLTITPYVNGSIEGFENRNGVTELLTIIKDEQGNNVDLEKYSVRLLFTDGQRLRENGNWFSAAMKLSDMKPSSKDDGLGLWRFNICQAEGENQFIPQYDSTYVITVQLFDENGTMVYTGKSGVNKFRVNEEPIFEERTATPSLACQHNYVEQDLGESLPIGSFKIAMCQADRYYKYLIFASNDNTLPLSKWTLIGEKSDEVTSDGYYEVKVQPTDDGYESYRYVRFICTFNSSNWGAHFAEIETYPAPKVLKEIPVTVTLGDGTDVTDTMTDNNYGTSLENMHWYDQFSGYRWTLEEGKLIIGGKGAVEEESYPWTRFADEITEIFVFPNSVDTIGKDAFKGLDKVEKIFIGEGVTALGDGALACGADGVTVTVFGGIESVGAKVLEGCTNVKVVLNGVTANELMSAVNEDNAVLAAATLEEKTVAGLSVTPYVNGDVQGFENRNGVTELLTILKDDAGNFMDLTNYTVRLLFTDGERNRENGTYVSSAMKLSDMQPSSNYDVLGLWRFNVCEAEGENQFIPQYDSAYVVTVMLYDEDGNLAYMGASDVNKFRVNAEPIYDEVTGTPGYAAKEHEDYIQLDFGKKTIVSALDVGFYQDGSRYYQFDVYATNDPTLPLSKWDYIGEQHDETPSSGSYRFDCGNDIGEYRYFRIYGTYNSSNWALHFAEVHAYTDPTIQTLTFVVDGVATERKFAEGDVPVVADPYKNPVYGENSETFYVFLGWSDGTTLYEAGTALPAVTAGVTYTAVFEELTDSWADEEPVDPPVDPEDPPVAGEHTAAFVLLAILCLAAVALAGKKILKKN